ISRITSLLVTSELLNQNWFVDFMYDALACAVVFARSISLVLSIESALNLPDLRVTYVCQNIAVSAIGIAE
ncbi:hypothetical protein ACWE6V_004831, partial [Escherichia coli]